MSHGGRDGAQGRGRKSSREEPSPPEAGSGMPGQGLSPGGLPAARCMRDSAWLLLMGRSTWDSARMRGL